MKVGLLAIMAISFVPCCAFALGGSGATCNPSTPNWGSCTLTPVPFQASVTKTVNIPGGNYQTPYQANQADTRYVLQGNINADSTGIVIGGKNVIIDLNGHTLTYNNVSAGEGVTMGNFNISPVAVRNGSIIQGSAMSEGDVYGRGNNPVGTYNTALAGPRSSGGVHISHLYVRYGGRDVGGIVWSGDNGIFEQNTLEDTYEFGTLKNRMHGSEALTGAKNAGYTGNVYRNNTIINTRQRGITTGDGSETYGNRITIRSIATNSAGVYQYGGKNISIHDNTIIGRGEHPLGMQIGGGSGGKNYEVYNNIMDMQITALGEEYGNSFNTNPTATHTGNSASGLRVTWGGDNINFHDNKITIVTSARYTGTYSPTGATAYINGGGKGLFIGVYAGETSTYSNNDISVIGDSNYTYGVTCSYSFSPGMYVVNNTITSSLHNIVVGDDYGACNDYPLFQGNTLIKSGTSANYKTISNTYNDTDRNSQARFVDNIYQGGASESSIALQPQNSGKTDIYFGSMVGVERKYNYHLHDAENTSTILLREDFEPPITLPYPNTGDIPDSNPTVTITAPSAATTYSTAIQTVNFAGTSADDGIIAGVTWSCPTCLPVSGTVVGTTAWSFGPVTLARGLNTVTVSATDAGGKIGTDYIGITYTGGEPDPICDPSHLNLCTSGNCAAAGGYWYGSQCNQTPEAPGSGFRMTRMRFAQ